MAPTTLLALSPALPPDVLGVIDGFRRQRWPMERTVHDRQALRKAQKQWISLRAKQRYSGRFDVALPPFPTMRDMEGGLWAYAVYANDLFHWFRAHYDT